jgi:UPF0755 protein
MKRTGLIVTLVIGLVAFVCGFGGVTAALIITQPAASAHVAVLFTVNQGDTVDQVANNLHAAGLIRNVLAFRVLAKLKRAVFQAGTYTLYSDMTMDGIIAALENGSPVQQVSILIPPGWRVTQYPALFAKLPNFNASDFMKIATTGNYLNGTPVNTDYWFVPTKKATGVRYALEGFLSPDTYDFLATDNAQQVIQRLLNAFGENLCPGPDAAHADAYLSSVAQCKAHPATISGKSIFTLLEKNYSTSNDQLALYEALTLASIAEREVTGKQTDIQQVTDALYNRYLNNAGKYPNPPANSPTQLEADPTVQYARDSDHPPTTASGWWAKLPPGVAKASISPNNPYNTYVITGLPPGPISAPEWVHHLPAAVNVSMSQYFYYFAAGEGNPCANVWYYATTYDQFLQLLNQHPTPTC